MFIEYNDEEKNQIKLQIENYVHAHIYYKIFNNISSNIDRKIYVTCSNYNWIQPTLINKKFENLDEKIIKLMVNFINNIENGMCPKSKLREFEKVLLIVDNLTDLFGYDENCCYDLLVYTFIKAKPRLINSNFLYIKMFLGEINEQIKSKLNKLEQIIQKLSVFSEKNLISDVPEKPLVYVKKQKK